MKCFAKHAQHRMICHDFHGSGSHAITPGVHRYLQSLVSRLTVLMKSQYSILALAYCTFCLNSFMISSALAGEIDCKKAAEKVDQFILENLQSKQRDPNPPISDEQFTRRVYLAIIGRIPTTAEARAFQESTSAEKHSDLIHELLANDTAYTRTLPVLG